MGLNRTTRWQDRAISDDRSGLFWGQSQLQAAQVLAGSRVRPAKCRVVRTVSKPMPSLDALTQKEVAEADPFGDETSDMFGHKLGYYWNRQASQSVGSGGDDAGHPAALALTSRRWSRRRCRLAS